MLEDKTGSLNGILANNSAEGRNKKPAHSRKDNSATRRNAPYIPTTKVGGFTARLVKRAWAIRFRIAHALNVIT